MSGLRFRYDIQILRGIAVLLVLLYHAGIGPFKAGYLGVDIFFVISGFLITSMISKQMHDESFSFLDFYFRRAKRLLPVAYVVIGLTLVGSTLTLTHSNFHDFFNQLLGSITFTANFALYDQSGYFEGESKAKPLLHMWSLAIEEQFYLLLPACLFFLKRRFWKAGAAIATITSLVLCYYYIHENHEFTFFMLPFRAWELGLGCIGALYIRSNNLKTFARLAFWPSLVALIVIPVFPISPIHPYHDAVIVCIATLLIIVHQSEWLTQPKRLRALGKIGDWSYTLYLVHWPLFALASSAFLYQKMDISIRTGLLALSFVISIILYYTIEKPIHQHNFAKKRHLVLPLILASLLLAGSALFIDYKNDKGPDYEYMRRHNYGLGISCSQEGLYEKLPQCQTSDEPEVMVWGDSYAMHLVPGIAKLATDGMIQATKSACAPFLGYSFYLLPQKNLDWAKNCADFNKTVLKALEDMTSVKTVVLSSPYSATARLTYPGIFQKNGEGEYENIQISMDYAIKAMQQTVSRLHALGKKVVVVSPPPRGGYNKGECLERKNEDKITISPNADCEIILDPKRLQSSADEFLERTDTEGIAPVIYLSDYLCENKNCKTQFDDGTFVYRDGGHLAVEGSEKLFMTTPLFDDIMRQAR